MGLQKFQTTLVILVIAIDVGKERPGIDNQCDWGTSFLMMCSICSAIDP